MIGKKNEKVKEKAPAIAFDPDLVDAAFERFRLEQDITRGVLAGVAAAALGVVIWAVLVVMTGSASVWMGMGVAVLAGVAIRMAGKGFDERPAIIGALLTLVGCALGRIFAICHFMALKEGKKFLEVLSGQDPATLFRLLTANYTLIDLLFYGMIAYTCYRLCFRQYSDAEIISAMEACNRGA